MMDRLLAELSAAFAMTISREPRARYIICVCPSIFTLSITSLFRSKNGVVLAIVHDIQSGLGTALGGNSIGRAMAALRRFERWAFNRCDVLVSLSTGMADELRGLGVSKPILVQPPHVDVSEICPRVEVEAPNPILLYSGNIGKKQGLEQLIDLGEELARRNSSAVIVIRGEGSERAALESLCLQRGVTNIQFLDLAPRPHLSAVMADATLHLVPQRPDGANFAVPSKVFSIMAAGRAFIATASADSPLGQLAKLSGAGVTVAPDDAAAFADAVELLLNDHGLRSKLGAAGRRYVVENVDRNVVCGAILTALTSRQYDPFRNSTDGTVASKTVK
jgi:colanic acid biosynthesis glycosyl transferase WcaI